MLACQAEVGRRWLTVAGVRACAVARLVATMPAAPLSSVTSLVETPPITGTSLVPWMVTVTSWLAVPSEETAVNESVKIGRAAGRGRGEISVVAVSLKKKKGERRGGGVG